MTRKETKELLPIMQAFAEGKIIQVWNNTWKDTTEDPYFCGTNKYRIKPEPKYRPFKNQEECWNEMYKHSDIGWIINKSTKSIYHINVICHDEICLDETSLNYYEVLAHYEFLDGTPFGIKE